MVVTLVLTVVITNGLSLVFGQVMTSSNFQIQSDSVNPGGGLSSSSAFQIESTAGEVATGESSSGSYQVRAGYQQMQSIYLALSGAANITMDNTISGVTGGTANGSTTVTVTTDNLAGYQLTIEAENSPAMQKGVDTIADYVPGTANPDFSFMTGASDAHLAYSPQGVDVVPRFRDNGALCAVGSFNTLGACWDGLATAAEPIASASTDNHPSGATTTVNFRVWIGGSVTQPAGNYFATTTITALPL